MNRAQPNFCTIEFAGIGRGEIQCFGIRLQSSINQGGSWIKLLRKTETERRCLVLVMFNRGEFRGVSWPSLLAAAAFLTCCISVAFATSPVVIPLKKYDPALDSSLNKLRSPSSQLHHSHSHSKRGFHTPMPINFVQNEYYDAPLKGKSYQSGFFITHFIGTPPQSVDTLVDTGSSNLAISCSPTTKLKNFFDPLLSSTYVRYHGFYASAELRYGDGQMGGDLAGDFESIAIVNSSVLLPLISENLTIGSFPSSYVDRLSVKFACIMYSTPGIFITAAWQGVMGMAYGTIVKPSNRYETFFDSLIDQTNLPNVFTLQLCGIPVPYQDNSGALRGNLIFGGGDSKLQSTQMFYTSLATQSFYGIILTDFLVNGVSLGLDCTSYNDPVSIIDSGTSDWLIPTTVYDALVVTLASQVDPALQVPQNFWTSNMYLCLTTGNTSIGMVWQAFPTITLHVALNGTTNQTFAIVVPPSSYIRVAGTTNGEFCYVFAAKPVNSSFINSIIGLVVLEGLYLEFDRANAQVGIAQSSYCDNDNPLALVTPRIYGPINVNYTTSSCLVTLPHKGVIGQNTALIVLGAVLAALVVLVLVLFLIFAAKPADYASPYSRIGEGNDVSPFVQ